MCCQTLFQCWTTVLSCARRRDIFQLLREHTGADCITDVFPFTRTHRVAERSAHGAADNIAESVSDGWAIADSEQISLGITIYANVAADPWPVDRFVH